MQWFAQAPSNIALIKYMGKLDIEKNLPANPSLSYTLNQLISSVMIETYPGKKDMWEPLDNPGSLHFKLSIADQTRFLNHFTWLKKKYAYTGCFIVRSCNNFPHSSGLASSASSFAALTKAAILAFSELTQAPIPTIEIQAALSRHASGSSCRSFFAPWALWDGEQVSTIDLPYTSLIHQAIIISHDIKEVPSSEAHIRVQTSPLYINRSTEASQNLKTLTNALTARDWANAYLICWREFQDMHRLFATASPAFSYMNEKTNEVLKNVQDLWQKKGDGPLVTMDAGPNIHLLYREDQASLAMQFKHDYLLGNYDVL